MAAGGFTQFDPEQGLVLQPLVGRSLVGATSDTDVLVGCGASDGLLDAEPEALLGRGLRLDAAHDGLVGTFETDFTLLGGRLHRGLGEPAFGGVGPAFMRAPS